MQILVAVKADPLQNGGSISEVAASIASKMALLEPEQAAQVSGTAFNLFLS